MAEAVVTGPSQAPVLSFSLRSISLITAIVIYALFSVPTPEQFGIAELAVGTLLIAAVGVSGLSKSLSAAQPLRWQRAGLWLLLYGLTVPVFSGLIHGNASGAMIRDIIPFLFLLLPLFVFPGLAGRPRRVVLLTAATCFVGLVFAGRVLSHYMGGQFDVPDPHRLANAPTVLFSALLLTGVCGALLYRGETFKSLGLFLLSLVPLAAMALVMQRASIGVYVITVFLLLGAGLLRRPHRMALPLAVIGIALLAYWPVVSELVAQLWQKNEAVGFNMRWQEARAVIEAVSDSAWSVLLGQGWGATVASPAVGGDVVNFTHSIITTYWLKTGLAGVALLLHYLLRLGLLLFPLLKARPVVALALGGPFAIDVLLYASFKSLDFGLLLLLIPLWANLLQKPPGSCKQEHHLSIR